MVMLNEGFSVCVNLYVVLAVQCNIIDVYVSVSCLANLS